MYNHLTLQMYDLTLTALAGYVGKAECFPSSTTVERLQTLQQWKFASCPDAVMVGCITYRGLRPDGLTHG